MCKAKVRREFFLDMRIDYTIHIILVSAQLDETLKPWPKSFSLVRRTEFIYSERGKKDND